MIIAALSTKGGVGKSSVVSGLASAAWYSDTPITVVDADPSGNSSWALGVETGTPGLAEVLRGEDAGAVTSGWGEPLQVVPSGNKLGEVDLGQTERKRLTRFLTSLGRDGRLVVVDCPAGVGATVRAVLEAVDAAVVVTEPSTFGVRAVEDTDAAIAAAKRSNQRLENLGIIVNRLPGRGREARERFAELETLAGRRLWRPAIPSRVVMAEAVSDGTAIHVWGARGSEIAGIFDSYLARIKRRSS